MFEYTHEATEGYRRITLKKFCSRKSARNATVFMLCGSLRDARSICFIRRSRRLYLHASTLLPLHASSPQEITKSAVLREIEVELPDEDESPAGEVAFRGRVAFLRGCYA